MPEEDEKKENTNVPESDNEDLDEQIQKGYIVRDKDKNKTRSDDKGEKDGKKTGKGDKEQAVAESNKNKTLADEMKEAVQKQKETSESDTEELALFVRKKKEKRYTIWILDEWLYDTLDDWNILVVCTIEILIVTILLIGPSVPWLIREWKNIDFESYFKTPGDIGTGNQAFFRIGLFTLIWYVFDIFMVLIGDNSISLASPILYTLQLNESEFIWSLVDIFYTSRTYLRLSLDCLLVFYLMGLMFTEYKKPDSFNIFDTMTIRALILWFGIYTGMLFIMKFALSIFIYDIKRSSYKEVIWNLNHKMFIYRKLHMISECRNSSEVEEICENTVPSYDPGFYLKDVGFFTSKEDAGIVAQNIMVRLNKKELTYEDIQKYFPQDHTVVFRYLTNTDTLNKDQVVKTRMFKESAMDLYVKRKDIGRTLKDRDYIFDKLEVIFFLIVTYIAAIIFCMLFNVDYNFYLFGFGTTILTFSWVFADTIKKLFNCFVFVLVLRPYVIGDRVVIDSEEYTVQKIDLLTSTFLNGLKTIVYMPNDVLMNSKILNMARSPPQSMLIELTVDAGTSVAQAKKLEEVVREDIKKASNHFTNVEMKLKTADKIYYVVGTVHNFQNTHLVKVRQEKLIKIFDAGLSKAHIVHKNAFVFKVF